VWCDRLEIAADFLLVLAGFFGAGLLESGSKAMAQLPFFICHRSISAAVCTSEGDSVFRLGNWSACCRPLLAPVDIASLVCFRVLFGLLMCWKIWEFHLGGGVESSYVLPKFHFTYLGFGWIRPWPAPWMHVHFAVLGVLSLCLLSGLFYRLSATLFFLGVTYVFLLEQTYYLNHEYLICLISLILIFVPAHRALSLDARFRPAIRSRTAPAWSLWLLRFQVAIPYLYGGLAKLDHDWLHGASLRAGLGERTSFPLIGRYFTEDWMVSIFVYGGLLFDLLIVPLLLWRSTRIAAFVFAVTFHLMNAWLFNIGVFPWLMIAGTMLFFPPDWPRRAANRLLRRDMKPSRVKSRESSAGKRRTINGIMPTVEPCVPPALDSRPSTLNFFGAVLLGVYLTAQLVLPFRHHLYPGNASWTAEGDWFAWRMMLNHKRGRVTFYATDPNTRQSWPVEARPMLTRWQYRHLSEDPDLILQFAHSLAERLGEEGFGGFEIHAVVLVSLNGRKPQLLIDPGVNLAAQPRTLRPKRFVLTLTEPLREEPWDVPVRLWPRHVPVAWPPETEASSGGTQNSRGTRDMR
jgi:hypothetical protein